jgi:hypothetical protein
METFGDVVIKQQHFKMAILPRGTDFSQAVVKSELD